MRRRPTKLFQTSPYREIRLFAVPMIIMWVVLIGGIVFVDGQQFSLLAKAFLHGQLNYLTPIGGYGEDPVLYHGKIFWDEGPFPALLLVPFVGLFGLFHTLFYQGYLQWLLILGVLYFVFRLARILNYSREDSGLLMFGFALGSAFIGVAAVPSSWLFAQVVTTFLLSWSLYEFYTRKRWWLIGVICAMVVMTRVTAAPILLFFAWELWLSTREEPRRSKLVRFAQLGLPVVAALGLIGLYNFLRFHSPFDGGYAYQLLPPGSPESKARAQGVFSLAHIPNNFYHMVLGTPTSVATPGSPWMLRFPFVRSNNLGMSIFLTSPYLLYLFSQKWSSFDVRARRLLVAGAASALLVLSYYGVGQMQFGYRYSLDFFPELFLVFMILYRAHNVRLSTGMRALLIGAGIVNFYILWSFIV
jgi:hypothetical protein